MKIGDLVKFRSAEWWMPPSVHTVVGMGPEIGFWELYFAGDGEGRTPMLWYAAEDALDVVNESEE